MITKRMAWVFVVLFWLSGLGLGLLVEARLHLLEVPRHGLSFSGEPSRGAFTVPQSGIKYIPPAGETMKTWECLVAVTGDDPAVWHYRVWREDDPSRALTGKGVVEVP